MATGEILQRKPQAEKREAAAEMPPVRRGAPAFPEIAHDDEWLPRAKGLERERVADIVNDVLCDSGNVSAELADRKKKELATHAKPGWLDRLGKAAARSWPFRARESPYMRTQVHESIGEMMRLLGRSDIETRKVLAELRHVTVQRGLWRSNACAAPDGVTFRLAPGTDEKSIPVETVRHESAHFVHMMLTAFELKRQWMAGGEDAVQDPLLKEVASRLMPAGVPAPEIVASVAWAPAFIDRGYVEGIADALTYALGPGEEQRRREVTGLLPLAFAYAVRDNAAAAARAIGRGIRTIVRYPDVNIARNLPHLVPEAFRLDLARPPLGYYEEAHYRGILALPALDEMLAKTPDEFHAFMVNPSNGIKKIFESNAMKPAMGAHTRRPG